jgi:hypothetical protein
MMGMKEGGREKPVVEGNGKVGAKQMNGMLVTNGNLVTNPFLPLSHYSKRRRLILAGMARGRAFTSRRKSQ